jgi:hypothetical protein
VTSIPGSSDLFALCICLNFNPKIIESFDLLSHKLKHEVVEGNEELRKPQNLIPPFSKVVSHFGISGISVALATGVTHPLG